MRVCVRVFSVGFGPGLDSMSPARSRRSASHAAGTHGWLPQKTGRPGLRRGGVGGYNLHSVPPDSPSDSWVPKISAYSWWNCQATHNRLQIEINYYPDSLLFVSAGFLPRASSQRLN